MKSSDFNAQVMVAGKKKGKKVVSNNFAASQISDFEQ
jgi:hypothetical protein